jgi:hypothetical protein
MATALVHRVLLGGAVLEVSSMFGWLQVGWQVGVVIMIEQARVLSSMSSLVVAQSVR